MSVLSSKILETFKKNLKSLMDRDNLSQTDLANILGKRPTNINRYVTGEVEPKISALQELAGAFKIQPHELLLPEIPKETPTISVLSKLIEKQSKMLDGNEELLELWQHADDDHREMILKQLRRLAPKSSSQKHKA